MNIFLGWIRTGTAPHAAHAVLQGGPKRLPPPPARRSRTRTCPRRLKRTTRTPRAAARALQERAEESVGDTSRLIGELLVGDLPARQTPTYPLKPRHMLELHRSSSLNATVTVLNLPSTMHTRDSYTVGWIAQMYSIPALQTRW